MRVRQRKKNAGSMLLELMLSAVVIGIVATAVLETVAGSQTKMADAKRRAYAIAILEDSIDTIRASGRSSALSTGTTSSNRTIPTVPYPAVLTQSISLLNGYTNLYLVRATISWTSLSQGKSRTESATLTTYVRAPDA